MGFVLLIVRCKWSHVDFLIFRFVCANINVYIIQYLALNILGDMSISSNFATNLMSISMSTKKLDKVKKKYSLVAPTFKSVVSSVPSRQTAKVLASVARQIPALVTPAKMSFLSPVSLSGTGANLMSSSGRAKAAITKKSILRDLIIGAVLFVIFLWIFTWILNTNYSTLSKKLQAFANPDVFAQNQRIPQAWLTRYSISATAESDFVSDVDSDGLTLEQEYQYLTNPLIADTDGDGVKDGQEIRSKMNPLGKGILDMNGDGVVDSRSLSK